MTFHLLLSVGLLSGLAVDDDLTERALAAHRAALSAMPSHSYRIDLKRENLVPQPSVTDEHAYFWFSEGRFRCRNSRVLPDGAHRHETVVGHAGAVTIFTQTDSGPPGAVVLSDRKYIALFNGLNLCMFEFYVGPIEPRLSLDDLYRQAGKACVT
ncbi:MAG TPA: hypothetical protein PKD86_18965 [Gemmatales bacterium]|nr:hypothetical protein [Gemmatales bacterium]HMP61428.1 hypothetical protein [Gemmatales bacterium]